MFFVCTVCVCMFEIVLINFVCCINLILKFVYILIKLNLYNAERF